MPVSSRLYHCCLCHARVIICSRCDRGQRYCADDCRHEARSASRKRAVVKYQSSRKGRFNNAARQQCFRQRQQQKVTHQGSTPQYLHDLLKTRLTALKKAQKPSLADDSCQCHFCGVLCDPFLRQDFLVRRLFSPFKHQSETT
jgi:hypothetical protein